MKHSIESAILAAGCFWGVQAYFDRVPGVVATTVGYTGGHLPHPSYEQVCTHTTGHAEATKIEFDPSIVSYGKLLEHFFRMHDPTEINRQGPDIGDNYRSAIFYQNAAQKQTAEQLIGRLINERRFERQIATEVTKATAFYPAEAYHQKYFDKTGDGACHVWPSEAGIE